MKKSLYLYLDDVRIPLDPKWIVAKDYDEFVEIVNREGLENFKVISLDHDLGDSAMDEYFNNVHRNGKLDYDNITEKTGMDCAKFLIDVCLDTDVSLPQVYVHSANPIGSKNIMGIINRWLLFNDLPQTCVRVRIPHTVKN